MEKLLKAAALSRGKFLLCWMSRKRVSLWDVAVVSSS